MAAPTKTTARVHKTGAQRGAPSAEKRTRKPAAPRKAGTNRELNGATEGVRRLQLTEAAPFSFNGQTIRVGVQDGEPWFVSVDVCAQLEHSNSRMAISGLDDDEKGVTSAYTLGGEQTLNVVNESGLYQLIFKSKKPQAKAFRRWVTREVLPSIRKTGSYKSAEVEAPDEIRLLQVDLPGPGRYVVMAAPGTPAQVRRADYDGTFAQHDFFDRQLLACALTTTAAYWHKMLQVRAAGADQAEISMLNRLERAILDGSILGADCLRVLSMQRGEG